LQEKVAINDRDFFKEPLTQAEIEALLRGRPAEEMFSFRSPAFKALGLAREKLTNDQLIGLMLKEPRLVRRPVVKIGRQVYFGADAKRLAEVIK